MQITDLTGNTLTLYRNGLNANDRNKETTSFSVINPKNPSSVYGYTNNHGSTILSSNLTLHDVAVNKIIVWGKKDFCSLNIKKLAKIPFFNDFFENYIKNTPNNIDKLNGYTLIYALGSYWSKLPEEFKKIVTETTLFSALLTNTKQYLEQRQNPLPSNDLTKSLVELLNLPKSPRFRLGSEITAKLNEINLRIEDKHSDISTKYEIRLKLYDNQVPQDLSKDDLIKKIKESKTLTDSDYTCRKLTEMSEKEWASYKSKLITGLSDPTTQKYYNKLVPQLNEAIAYYTPPTGIIIPFRSVSQLHECLNRQNETKELKYYPPIDVFGHSGHAIPIHTLTSLKEMWVEAIQSPSQTSTENLIKFLTAENSDPRITTHLFIPLLCQLINDNIEDAINKVFDHLLDPPDSELNPAIKRFKKVGIEITHRHITVMLNFLYSKAMLTIGNYKKLYLIVKKIKEKALELNLPKEIIFGYYFKSNNGELQFSLNPRTLDKLTTEQLQILVQEITNQELPTALSRTDLAILLITHNIRIDKSATFWPIFFKCPEYHDKRRVSELCFLFNEVGIQLLSFLYTKFIHYHYPNQNLAMMNEWSRPVTKNTHFFLMLEFKKGIQTIIKNLIVKYPEITSEEQKELKAALGSNCFDTMANTYNQIITRLNNEKNQNIQPLFIHNIRTAIISNINSNISRWMLITISTMHPHHNNESFYILSLTKQYCNILDYFSLTKKSFSNDSIPITASSFETQLNQEKSKEIFEWLKEKKFIDDNGNVIAEISMLTEKSNPIETCDLLNDLPKKDNVKRQIMLTLIKSKSFLTTLSEYLKKCYINPPEPDTICPKKRAIFIELLFGYANGYFDFDKDNNVHHDTNAFEAQLLEMININNSLKKILTSGLNLSNIERPLFTTFSNMIDQYLSTYIEKTKDGDSREEFKKIQDYIASTPGIYTVDPHNNWKNAIRYIQFLENDVDATDNINKLFQKLFNFRPESDDINEWLTDLKTKFSLSKIQTYIEIINESKQNTMYRRLILNPFESGGAAYGGRAQPLAAQAAGAQSGNRFRGAALGWPAHAPGGQSVSRFGGGSQAGIPNGPAAQGGIEGSAPSNGGKQKRSVAKITDEEIFIRKTSIFSKKTLEELINKNYGPLRNKKFLNFYTTIDMAIRKHLKRSTLELAIKKWYRDLNKTSPADILWAIHRNQQAAAANPIPGPSGGAVARIPRPAAPAAAPWVAIGSTHMAAIGNAPRPAAPAASPMAAGGTGGSAQMAAGGAVARIPQAAAPPMAPAGAGGTIVNAPQPATPAASPMAPGGAGGSAQMAAIGNAPQPATSAAPPMAPGGAIGNAPQPATSAASPMAAGGTGGSAQIAAATTSPLLANTERKNIDEAGKRKRDVNDTSSELIKIAEKLLKIMNKRSRPTLSINEIIITRYECQQFLSSDKDNPDIREVSEKLTKLNEEKKQKKGT